MGHCNGGDMVTLVIVVGGLLKGQRRKKNVKNVTK